MSKKNKKNRPQAKKKASPVSRKGREVVSEAKLEEVETEYITFPEVLPLLPARDMVAFPGVMMSLFVARPGSIAAIDEANKGDKLIFVVSQKDHSIEEAKQTDLNKVGVIANIVRVLKHNDGRYKVLLQGLVRAEVQKITRQGDGAFFAKLEVMTPIELKDTGKDIEKVLQRIRTNLQALVEAEHVPEELLLVTEEIDDAGMLSDVILAHYKLDPQAAQTMLEEQDPKKRLVFIDKLISDDLKQFQLSQTIREKTQNEMTNAQREYFLREQIRLINKELGETDTAIDDLSQLKNSLKNAKMPKQADQEAQNQLRRLERMHPESSEYALIRTYLEWMADIPWSKSTKDLLDLSRAKKILEKDHHGLEKAKDRIIEYLSVRKLSPQTKGPILCFVGPPGVGKTSLGRSIAEALGRTFFRISLGGVRDEAEIRGHRRTYVGALPGRIVQGLKQAGSNNPVIVLDELDKVGADFRGDPASALLEVLDPSQNKEFRDHYLNVDFDLSNVLFIATANTIDTIPDALLDRLEVIFIPGYTAEEKLEISKRFLVPRQLKECGISKEGIKFNDESLTWIIDRYTREAGVRNLEREIGALCRKIAREKVEKKKVALKVTPESVTKLLGVTKFDPEETEKGPAIGLVRGLAWTIHGGEVMPVEASVAKGSGNLALTGQLGSVMQESAQAALFYARSNSDNLNLDPGFTSKYDIHIHLPGGATPKDGPSAGVTIVTALVSALSNRRVASDIAMTGEITLRGNVMAVGGLKEKVLAAIRYGITRVVIPFENVKDLDEIPKEQRDKIQFFPVKHISEVLTLALLDAPKLAKSKGSGARSKSSKKRLKPSITARA